MSEIRPSVDIRFCAITDEFMQFAMKKTENATKLVGAIIQTSEASICQDNTRY
jgi:hypothetical protein